MLFISFFAICIFIYKSIVNLYLGFKKCFLTSAMDDLKKLDKFFKYVMYLWSPKLTLSLPKGRSSTGNSTNEVPVLESSKWILLMKVRKTVSMKER